MAYSAQEWQAVLVNAATHLKQHDPILARVVDANGLCTIQPHDNYYQALVSSIIGQQLSVKAAASIRQRFEALFDGHFPTPDEILRTDTETLRGVGLSRPKIQYIFDLAKHIRDGKLLIEKLPELSNEEIIRELVAVKGIGEWTAHMFLIFSLGRPDVLPIGDLGIRNGVQRLYGLPTVASADDIIAIAAKNQWHPYESIASWYVWRSLDNEPTA